MDKLLTPRQIADILDVQPSAIYQWTHQGFIPHVMVERFVKFRERGVTKLLERRFSQGRTNKNVEVRDLVCYPPLVFCCELSLHNTLDRSSMFPILL